MSFKSDRTLENPVDGVCSFFVVRKSRFCKMRTKENSKYCGEHQNHDPSMQMNRILCPLDPKQYLQSDLKVIHILHSTVEKHNLECHLLKCNKRKKPNALYFDLDLNMISSSVVRNNEDIPEPIVDKQANASRLATAMSSISFLWEHIDVTYVGHSTKESISPANHGASRKNLLQNVISTVESFGNRVSRSGSQILP